MGIFCFKNLVIRNSFEIKNFKFEIKKLLFC